VNNGGPLPRRGGRTASRKSGDPRPSLQELYGSREAYDKRVHASIEALIAEGFLLERDRSYELEAARRRWAWITRELPPTDPLR
jgi:hypothetical protein